MNERSGAEFSADDLAMLDGDGDGQQGQQQGGDGGKDGQQQGAQAQDGDAKAAEAKDGAEAGKDKATLAQGGDPDAEAAKLAKPEYWPKDWREKAAEHIAAGDKKAYDRELRRLQRITDPTGLYGMYRELEGKLTGGGLIKVPGKGAKPEEIAEYHKALGVPEKAEDYLKTVKLDNGAILGEADKPLVDGFAQAVHKTGATPAFVNAALNWYFAEQERQAADLDQADDDFRRASQQELKDEWGASFNRRANALGSLFQTAPGGHDVENVNSLFSRLMGGRMADGSIIGNDPSMLKWLDSLRNEINPAVSVVEDGDQSGMSIDTEIAAIEKRMRDDRRGYFKDETAQNRYRQLLEARDKIQARNR